MISELGDPTGQIREGAVAVSRARAGSVSGGIDLELGDHTSQIPRPSNGPAAGSSESRGSDDGNFGPRTSYGTSGPLRSNRRASNRPPVRSPAAAAMRVRGPGARDRAELPRSVAVLPLPDPSREDEVPTPNYFTTSTPTSTHTAKTTHTKKKHRSHHRRQRRRPQSREPDDHPPAPVELGVLNPPRHVEAQHPRPVQHVEDEWPG